MLLHRFLERAAVERPDAIAVIDGRRRLSYAELDVLASRFATLLQQAGVGRHDRVLFALDNSIEFVAGYFGALKAGAVAVPLPAGPRNDRLARTVADCTPAAAFVDTSAAASAETVAALRPVPAIFATGRRQARRDLPVGWETLADALNSASAQHDPIRSIDLDLAAIIYTSGSTGEPRGVMLTHRNFVANARSIVSYLALTAGDRVMCVLPFSYVYGLSLLHTHVMVGGSVVIDNRFVFPNLVLQAMADHAVTGFAGVPSTFALLLHRSDLGSVRLPALRYVTQAGGAMSSRQIRDWLARGPAVPFYVMYGATEAAARLAYLEPARLADKIGSIGRPIPNVEIVVVREDGGLAATGEVGELVARGSNIARGYWNDPEETAARFGPRGYRTGDLGYRDAEGFLYLVGRRHDMIKVGAHRVGAREIEEVLHEFPGVVEAAVVGASHDLLGEVPVAFIAVHDVRAFDREALQAFCRARLPQHKMPAHLFVRRELPKLGALGKLDKPLLRTEAQAALSEAPTV